mmetsp:Transcript_19713/g.29360  ORF Transcript_19713/g.29360 Transcript_19713/m.29360 type:complete len:125 (+) Transcript_19713:133-507(+)
MGAACCCCSSGKLPENVEYIGVWVSDDQKATLEITSNGRVNWRTNAGENVQGIITTWREKNTLDGGKTFVVSCCCCWPCSRSEFDVSKEPEESAGQFQRSVGGQYKAEMKWRMVVNGYRLRRED